MPGRRRKMKIKNKKGETTPPIAEILKEIRHYLPSQGPIKDFIHHNTLHMFQEHGLTFHESVRQASRLYGSREYLPLSEYRALYDKGQITDEGITAALRPYKEDAKQLKKAMLESDAADVQHYPGFRKQGYLSAIKHQCGIMLEEQVHPIVYRLVANYLDQGIAAISLADHSEQGGSRSARDTRSLGARTGDFWQVLHLQMATARTFGISADVAQLIADHTAEEVVDICLIKLLPPGASVRTFLTEVLMAARGWSGLIAQVEDRPDYLNYPRQITLMHYLALYLAVFTEFTGNAGYDQSKIEVGDPNTIFFTEHAPVESEAEKIFRLWHEALELSFYLDTLKAIGVNAGGKRNRSSRAGTADFHAVFCIDDRECSVRRYLEEFSDKVETFGTPGFFAIDAVYQGPFDAISIKQCPVPVTPRHRIRGISRVNGRLKSLEVVPRAKRKLQVSRLEMNFWHRHANHFLLGSVISLVFGLVSLIRLAFSIHRPSRTFSSASSFSSHEDLTDLHYERPEGEVAKDGYFEGYTVAEMAERVGRVLRQIGLTHSFGSLVAIVGHGSSSTNNPYFAAYDCGACSGRPGLVNARAFALMANRDDVRALLKAAGIVVPESTRFVGAIHDTARDEVIFLDEEDLSPHFAAKLAEFKKIFTFALAHNAHERSRRFAIIEFPRAFKAALKEARLRTEMLFEPRPEYNHATNALAIVGRRSLTENLFLDRRAFFNSYDPLADKDGAILNGILTPLVPVCGGINLEYLFSRLDNTVFGAGSKLPHNVFSLVGVGNGSEGDLRTGLPEQMIEIHDPVRLMIVVEQRKEIVTKVLKNNPAVMQWIEKDWVKFSIYDYVQKKFYWFRAGTFEELKIPTTPPQVFADSMSVYRNQRDNIVPSLIKGTARA
jgi:uncharacterized protein